MSMGYCLDIAFWYSSEYGTDLTNNLAQCGIFWEHAVSINTHQLWRYHPADTASRIGQLQKPLTNENVRCRARRGAHVGTM